MSRLRSRPFRLVLALVLVAALAVALVKRQQIGDVYGYLFPSDIVDEATSRTSSAAEETDGPPLPVTSAPSREPGSQPAVALDPLVELDGPSALVDPPGPGPVLVTTLAGQVLEVDLGGGSSDVVLDLGDRISTGGERGLLGMALSPAGDRLFLNLTNSDGDTEVLSLPFRDGRPQGSADDAVRHLLVGQPYRNHNGGHLVFGPDGALWIGLGDGGSADDPAGLAQDVDVVLGKMLRVVPDRAGLLAPTSNPDWGGRPEVWGIGLRNPWRYSFDRETNQLWVADVGQNAVEEVTVVDPSQDRVNFGWDRVEGTRPFDGEPGPELTDPVVEYTHDEGGCSVTGGHVYRGERIPSLYGWYLFADYCGGWIRAVATDRPTAEPTELAADVGPVISFAELEDGELLVLHAGGISAIAPA